MAGRKKQLIMEKEKTELVDLADIIDDSFDISQTLLFLPVSTSEAGKDEITSLPVFPATSKSQTAHVQIWLCLCLAM